MTNPFQPTKQVCLTCKGTKTIHPQNDQCKNLYHQCPTCKGTGEVPAGAQNNGHDFRYVKVSGNRMCSLCGATKNTHEGISPCKVASPKSAELDEVLENWLEKVMSTSTLGWSPIDGYKGNEDESEAVAAQDYDKYKAEAKAAIESIIEGRVAEARLDEFLDAQLAWFNHNDDYFDERDAELRAQLPKPPEEDK